jgi:hypothetical protein
MSNELIGLNGHPLSEEKKIVGLNGEPLSTPAAPDISPVQALLKEETELQGKLIKLITQDNLDRGDMAHAIKLQSKLYFIQRTLFNVILGDMQSIIGETDHTRHDIFMLGNQIAMVLELMKDDGVTIDQINAKWVEVMEMAKAAMAASQESSEEEKEEE